MMDYDYEPEPMTLREASLMVALVLLSLFGMIAWLRMVYQVASAAWAYVRTP